MTPSTGFGAPRSSNNGRASLRRISYPGFYSMARRGQRSSRAQADFAPGAHRRCWRGGGMHRNGAFNLQLAFTFLGTLGVPAAVRHRSSSRRWNGPLRTPYGWLPQARLAA